MRVICFMLMKNVSMKIDWKRVILTEFEGKQRKITYIQSRNFNVDLTCL